MKNVFKYFFLVVFCSSFSQNNNKIDTIGVDVLNATYLLQDNTIYKKKNNQSISFLNVAFGDIYSVDILNSLEIIVFYRDFNTIAVLDNQLNLIQAITFQDTILFARKGITNKIWRFNNDTNKVELYDYKSKTVTLSSPLITNFVPHDMESGFNYVKLIGQNKILVFDRYLNLTETQNHQKNH